MTEDCAQVSEGNDDAAAQDTLRVLSHVVRAMDGQAREGQEHMAERIFAACQTKGHLLVQAGTGTGKSLGYLVPLLVHAHRSGQRALVSTATLALQRQILTKDAPLVAQAMEEVFGWRPKVTVFKGWSNYLCLNRVAGSYPGEDTLFSAFDEDSESSKAPSALGQQVVRLREWAKETDTGDRDDLTPGVTDRAWRQVSVSKRECLGRSCPMIDDCFAQAARNEAEDADLVVTNHSLFGIHCTGEGLFPEFGPVVIDEAHELADRVRDQATLTLSQGVVGRVARVAHARAHIALEQLETAAVTLGAALAALPTGLLNERPDALNDAVRLIDDASRRALSAVNESGAQAPEKTLARAALEELREFVAAWSADSMIVSLAASTPGAETDVLSIAPLHVAPALALRGFESRAAVLTSATLSLGGSFGAMAHESGFALLDSPWEGVDVGTPFDPATQAVMYIAQDLPDPGAGGLGDEAAQRFLELSIAAGGGVLGLFSSWKAAERAAEVLRDNTDLVVYMQGEETLSALVQRFREEEDSCLIGTKSLWQGVDVVGAACRLVVMDRIPFPHREDPVAKARSLDADRRGASGFHSVFLTKAALLMAQGAGRLLRSQTDRGVVAILDRRLLTKSYGAFLRRSLPQMWPTTDTRVVLDALRRLNTSVHEDEVLGEAPEGLEE